MKERKELGLLRRVVSISVQFRELAHATAPPETSTNVADGRATIDETIGRVTLGANVSANVETVFRAYCTPRASVRVPTTLSDPY